MSSFLDGIKKIHEEHEARSKKIDQDIKDNIQDFVRNPHKYSKYEEPVDLNGKPLYP